MNTKYGNLPDEMLVAYVDGMIAKVYKMLPMKQTHFQSLHTYMESTLREFIGQKELVLELKNNEEFLTILGTLESLLDQDDFKKFRSDIFKVINLIERLKNKLGGDENELPR
jgi:flagellin-specific chaperone FliS